MADGLGAKTDKFCSFFLSRPNMTGVREMVVKRGLLMLTETHCAFGCFSNTTTYFSVHSSIIRMDKASLVWLP